MFTVLAQKQLKKRHRKDCAFFLLGMYVTIGVNARIEPTNVRTCACRRSSAMTKQRAFHEQKSAMNKLTASE